jgi:hypothetical protein
MPPPTIRRHFKSAAGRSRAVEEPQGRRCYRGHPLVALLAAAGTLLAVSPSQAAITQKPDAFAARSAGVVLRSSLTCRGRRRFCPFLRSPPRLYSHLEGQPVRPLLTGNAYSIDSGVWYGYGQLRLSVEWLSRTGRVLSRQGSFTFTAAMTGAAVIIRECAHTARATTCATLRSPEAVLTPAAYLSSACGSRRPPAPPYDPDFAFLSAPHATGGWDPCVPVTWAIDEYGEPPLAAPEGATWQSVVSSAVAQLASATGIEFIETPNYLLAPGGTFATRPEGVDIGITFQPLEADVGGLGGPDSSRGQFSTAGGAEISSSGPWGVPAATETILHELGHAMGLGHPVPEPPAFDPSNAVMDPADTLFLSYQPGDLCGLYEIVWRAPCGGSKEVRLGQGVVQQ